MAKLELTLHGPDDFTKTLKEDYVSGQKFIDYLNLLNELEENAAELGYIESFVKKVEFLASLFTKTPVTAEDIIKGVNSWELVDEVNRLINIAMGASGEDPKLETSLSETLESDI